MQLLDVFCENLKRYKLKVLFVYLFVTVLLTVGCTNGYGFKDNDRMQITSSDEEILDSGEIIVARGAISGEHKLENLVGMSEDGRYWLFQSDRLKKDGDDLKSNENATLTFWDNTEQKVILNLIISTILPSRKISR
ncbi:MAG: hypothetical protein PHD36_09385 [Desulfotomaculaceae bacterium]|nr:hypothetical protein [Desulfotomaculaceae bacterium]